MALVPEQQLFAALSMGIRDYVQKCGFKAVVLGLSGGIDSALTAVLAVDALGADKVMGISMPARYSSTGSLTDAEALAKKSGHHRYGGDPHRAGVQGGGRATGGIVQRALSRMNGRGKCAIAPAAA